MNKKFFTLIASAFMLVASLGTVNAIGLGTATNSVPKDPVKRYQLAGELKAAPGAYYLLTTNENGFLYAYPYATFPRAFGESLWCTTPKDEALGQNPTFDFVNVRGFDLLVSAEDTVNTNIGDPINVGLGNLGGWGFSRTYTSDVEKQRVLYTYFTTDSVLVLTLKTGSNFVGVKKFLATQLDPTHASTVYNDPEVLMFTLWEPAPITLTATDYNTKLGDLSTPTYVSLTFDKDHAGVPSFKNPWSDFKLKAYASKYNPGYLNFELKDAVDAESSEKWLRVDTSHVNSVGSKFLAFAFGDTAGTNIRNQYEFKAVYYYSSDSLVITAYEARFNADYDAKTKKPLWIDSHVTSSTSTSQEVKDSLNLKLQDLVAADNIRIITVGPTPLNTTIHMGVKACGVSAPNFTSLDNGLYIITNDKGQTLVVPIYTLNSGNDTIPQWITLSDDVDPKRIPAYQWVVEKTRTTNKDNSPIKITNREFAKISTTNVQLYTDKATSFTLPKLNYGVVPNYLTGTTLKKGYFAKQDKTVSADSTLGYFFIDSLQAVTYGYELNYLHKYQDDEYLGVNTKTASDSTLFVSGNRSQFKFDIVENGYSIDTDGDGITDTWVSTGMVEDYGYYSENVDDLAQLKRVHYRIRIPGGSGLIGATTSNRYMVVDKEERYAVSGTSGYYGDFYLKTNNTKNDTDYYALLDILSGKFPTTKAYNKVVKVGIDDASLWAYMQVQDEVRTSAFAVKRYTEPLYRRFDGGEYGKAPVKEPYGDDTNSPIWLKFTKYNNFGNEFLFENSPRGKGSPSDKGMNDYRDSLSVNGQKTISFLGLYNEHQYPEVNTDKDVMNYTFYVDTAYVRDETPMPQYMLALRPEFVKGDTIWTVRKDSTWSSSGQSWYYTSDTTMRVRPSFTRAFYLFNAQDSIGYYNSSPIRSDYVGKFNYGAENTTRLAFVDGIHMGDTFYVVRGNIPTAEIDSTYLHDISAADKHYLGANTHYQPRWYSDDWNYDNGVWTNGKWVYNYKKNASAYNLDRNGKSMVFQFRLVDPANDRRFLIESRRQEDFYQDGTHYADNEIAPVLGRWLKIQNGVPVISENISISNARQNGSEIFDVMEGVEELATGNEETPVVTTNVKVISETGAVTILNAAGKNVAISNILGQTVANQTLNSNSATIALPKGIVVVAVEGEKAVKAIVK